MLTVETLEEYGADVRAGLSRCMNNENLYLRLVGMAVEEPAIASLGEALQAGDLDKAFEESHKLKGAMGNLALTPVYEPMNTLCELLRHKEPGDYEALYAESVAQIEKLKTLLS